LKPLLTLTVLIALLAPASADATLRMYGDARPRHFNWAREAQTNVPLPDLRLTIWSGSDPMYDPTLNDLFLPQPGWGSWTYHDEKLLFLHELGHAFDFRHLNRSERDRFRAVAGTSCSWWSTRCYLPGQPHVAEWNVPPGEMFAEMYAACALGLTRAEVEAQDYPSYGWQPPADTTDTLCDLIRVSIR
jgi:hypothetical protein